MNWLNWWIPLFALLMIVVVLPAWTYFVSNRTATLPIYVQFFASLMLPALAALLLASWLNPG